MRTFAVIEMPTVPSFCGRKMPLRQWEGFDISSITREAGLTLGPCTHTIG